jgi:tRNA threonylcarbamoyladenosine biosynthesis protein TsaE
VHFETKSAEETEELGRRLASARPHQPRALAVVYLAGELGAGKTTLARGFLRALGVAGVVRSPTFTLLEVYTPGSLIVLHVDLYRLRDPVELESLGLRDWARPGCLWLIEWPERGTHRLPPPDLTLTFAVGASAHDIDLRADSPNGQEWLARLTAAAGNP